MVRKTLGEICNVVSGGTPSRSQAEFWDDGTIPWIKIGNIKGKYVREADERITQAGLDGSSAKMFPKGTILYTIFATLGEVGILTIDACTNQAIAGITIKNQELLCRGWFLPPNTYDCGSFVVNGTAVVGKESKIPYNRCKSTQKGADFYEISI